MIEIKTKYYYAQDGEVASDEIKKLFKLDENELLRVDSIRARVFNIVGFIFKGEDVLVVYPKHFYSKTQIAALNLTHEEKEDDIKLIYNVIKEYQEKEKTKAQARKYIGAKDSMEFEADYPFASFYEIYDYFKKYGLYKETGKLVKSGGKGKVSWKNTTSKAQKIIAGGNLFFVPMYYNKESQRSVFVTECMAFVIDYTIDFFHSFLSIKPTGYRNNTFDYLGNIDYVIGQLNKAKKDVFKDKEKKLINSLIEFFVQYKAKSYGGSVHIKIRHFDKIWQTMVNQYLNKHFVGINSINKSVEFDLTRTTSVISFSEQTFSVDASHHGYNIRVDHIAQSKNELYIFDSKYYQALDDMEYKQFSYGELLREYYPGVTARYNVLLLPGIPRVDTHFSLATPFVGSGRPYVEIIEQYLDPKNVMEDYLKKD